MKHFHTFFPGSCRIFSNRNGNAGSRSIRPRPAAIALAGALAVSGCLQSQAPGVTGADGNTLATALATVPAAFSDVQVVSGLSNPTLMEIAPDGRIFVSEQAGRMRVVKNGALLAAPFVTLSVNSSGERGALGIAFDPAFASNHFVYVYYTSSADPHNRVSRFTANGDVAAAGETVLLDLPTLSSAIIHNGGAIHFGADGKLYIAVGDNANGANAQSLGTPLGKMLRINADGSVPSDNPFFASASGINRAIWALGLRNPFTFAVQPGTGRLFVNDVGQNTWEEIDEMRKGANYGWPNTEGNTTDPDFQSPFYAYDHSAGGCAVTGGAFYNPASAVFPPDYSGDYFFADYCGGWIKRLDPAGKAVSDFAGGISGPTDLKVGNDGALYYIARGSGSIRKIAYTNSQAPVISQQPSDRTVTVGGSAVFTVAASGSAPLAYRWQRNMADIPGATAASYALNNARPSDNGARFRCVVSNAAGSAASNEAVLTVTANHAPIADITAPAAGSAFRGGQTINYAGTGVDQEDGTLPASAFTWEVRLWHDDGNLHSHPASGPISGSTSGSFAVPVQGETSPNVWYRIYLTVKDAQAAAHTDSLDIRPVKANVTLASVPSGLRLNLDGSPKTAPFTFTGVAGMLRTVEAVSPQALGGKTWRFASWSDGGARIHTQTTPDAAATLTATYQEVAPVVYQAETAALSGAVAASNHAGYTGTGFVDYLNPGNDYIEWTVNASEAGAGFLDFRYALGASAARALRITVNGAVVSASLSFPGTGAWTTWRTVTLTASLNAGANKVRATTIGSSGPNVDNLAVR
ncbi:MAG TPA: PQQ-dependent sugar dehydrogenase [Fibrobacteria bacterium]|nr:PQQ-dependent sugar dehydrogenase [Fibrobacteria bacterium]